MLFAHLALFILLDTEMTAIVAHNLTKRYGSRVGIEGLNLAVPTGAVFGLLGPNGAGKTTMIRLLLGLLRPTGGRAEIHGLDCWRQSRSIKDQVGYVPGDLRLYSWMNARDAIHIFGKMRGADLRKPGRDLAEYFDLELDVRVRAMSRGMRQKLGLILALFHRPKLLVLDEPTSALDPLMQQRLYDHLRERAHSGGTVLFSSHSLSEVEQLCDRVAVFRNGRLVTEENLDALRNRAKREVTIRWADEQTAEGQPVPEFLNVWARRGCDWQCTLTGDVLALIHWSAARPLADLSIGRPDLESLFRQYYQERDGSG